MTKDKAIAELVRIWHSPHLDLSLKAGLAEVIETLKESNLNDSLVRGEVDVCKESKSKLDLISRQDALCILKKKMIDRPLDSDRWVIRDIAAEINSLPSAEPKTGEWIEVEVFPEVYDIEGVKTWGSEMQCDQCGFRHTAIEGHMAQYNFCPNCGARMKGGDSQ